MRLRKGCLFVVLVFSLFLINFVSSEILTSDAGVQYDSEILEKFAQNISSVRVSINIVDNSGIIVEGTKEERNNLIVQKENWKKNKTREVLETLSQNEFNLSLISVGTFEGNITKKGFEKLLKNPDVEGILDITDLPLAKGTIENENETNKTFNAESEDVKEGIARKNLFYWTSGVVFFIIIIFVVIKIRVKKDRKDE